MSTYYGLQSALSSVAYSPHSFIATAHVPPSVRGNLCPPGSELSFSSTSRRADDAPPREGCGGAHGGSASVHRRHFWARSERTGRGKRERRRAPRMQISYGDEAEVRSKISLDWSRWSVRGTAISLRPLGQVLCPGTSETPREAALIEPVCERSGGQRRAGCGQISSPCAGRLPTGSFDRGVQKTSKFFRRGTAGKLPYGLDRSDPESTGSRR